MSIFTQFGAWSWFIIAGVLLVGELAMPGAYLIWLGIAAAATGLLAWMLAPLWQLQLVGFAALALIAVVVGRLIAPKPDAASDRPFLNRRAAGLVGRSFVLDEPITGGVGRVRIDDTVWRIEGPDLVAGARVVIERADGATLTVRPA
ncbi:NfeD family protein [Ancylobacter terrae]|uniref:NfeD family protein n=1 Tax=Ancylobacter sp. sgz301288 TaxID=3342077 RepID=UPI00385F896C